MKTKILDMNKSRLTSSDISKFRDEITKHKIRSIDLYSNVSVFEQIKTALNQAILHECNENIV